MLLGPHFLEAADGRRRQTRRVLANEGRQRFLKVAGRDALQVEDRDQHLKALRPARVPRQDRWRVPNALALGWRTATGPMPVMISRSGRWPWRTTRWWPVAVLRSAYFARNSATSASTAWVSNARAPLRRTSVKESVKTPGWASLITLLSDTAYPSFIGEVEALNTTTIRRLTRSRRHQLLAIAHYLDIPLAPGALRHCLRARFHGDAWNHLLCPAEKAQRLLALCRELDLRLEFA